MLRITADFNVFRKQSGWAPLRLPAGGAGESRHSAAVDFAAMARHATASVPIHWPAPPLDYEVSMSSATRMAASVDPRVSGAVRNRPRFRPHCGACCRGHRRQAHVTGPANSSTYKDARWQHRVRRSPDSAARNRLHTNSGAAVQCGRAVCVWYQAQLDPTALSVLAMLLPADCTFEPWALACS
jgi:hypothetical protein